MCDCTRVWNSGNPTWGTAGLNKPWNLQHFKLVVERELL